MTWVEGSGAIAPLKMVHKMHNDAISMPFVIIYIASYLALKLQMNATYMPGITLYVSLS
jgi:hypothetical protein